MSDTISQISARLARLDASVVSDVLDTAGWRGQALSSAIRPLDPGMKLAGPAVCFRGQALPRDGAPAPEALSSYAMDEAVTPGAVVVVDAGEGAVAAGIGGLIALSLRRRGCGGVVVNGGVRDAGEIVELGLATFSRFSTPLNSAGRSILVEGGVTLSLPGQDAATVAVAPGDFILADRDGAIVVPALIAEAIVTAAEELVTIEARIVAGLRDGGDREAVFSANPRFAHVKDVMAKFGHDAV